MKKLGVVAEFNPFHNGHKYLLSEARRISGADVCVVAMSGNFVQRGGPAVIDKYRRTEIALNEGADLILEIPVTSVLVDAGRYASAGVQLLRNIGCDAIAFGSECGDSELLCKVAERLSNEAFAEYFEMRDSAGMSYPAARQKAYEEFYSDSETIEREISVLSSSNDILALEYIKAAGDMEIYAVKRVGAEYSQGYAAGAEFQSATGIRELAHKGDSIAEFVPERTSEVLTEAKEMISCAEKNYFNLARMSILKAGAEDIDNAPSGGDGLAARLKAAIAVSQTLDELIAEAKSKNITYTRISRLISQLILGIERADADYGPLYSRVLGFNEKGRGVLAEARKNEAGLRLIINVNKDTKDLGADALKQLEKDIYAGDVFNIISEKELYANSDKVRRPIIE